jgi:L-threonylcarbamoyladenylate synthase
MKILNTLSDDVAAMLKAGKVGVLPTDTIYGLVADAPNDMAAAKILEIKGRPLKPGTLIAASVDQLVELGIKARYLKAVEQFWPGAVSVVIPMGPELTYLHSGAFSLPVRIPDDSALRNFMQKTGPLISTSANLPDKTPARTAQEAYDIFGDKLDFYVDGGDLSDRPPSTIIRIIDDAIEVLREGAVKIDEETGRILK